MLKWLTNFFIIGAVGFNALMLNSCEDYNVQNNTHTDSVKTNYEQTIHDRAKEVSQYIQSEKRNQYNSDIAFLINFKRPSGEFRFFIYDLKNNQILHKGLVLHGSGSVQQNSTELVFSNVPNSLSTSLGKYKMGHRYMGDFGLAYKMYGLEESNSKAYERFIVFHAHDCVPELPVKREVCLSWGCPTVAPEFLKIAARYLDNSAHPIIMDIFYK